LVEMMGGTIGVHSQEGCGATFWFTLKLQPAQAQECQFITSNSGPLPPTAIPTSDLLKGRRLLVAEDQSVNRFIIEEMLKRFGCVCELVGNGLQAVEAVQREGYDAILMDCHMPVMDGLEATRRIRELEMAGSLSVHIPIIALTADAMSGDREACLAAGMDEYVSKPINPTELFTTISAFVADAQGHPEPPVSGEGKGMLNVQPPHTQSLLRRTGADKEFAIEILSRCRTQFPEELDRLKRALAKGDSEEFYRRAHNIKGMAGYASADKAATLAAELERMANEDRLSDAGPTCEELSQNIGQLVKWLQEDKTLARVNVAGSSEPATPAK
ncbi:MAG TPA: response regulator, partial [Tepidisphaeraceae bacterium]|nr:response regulator [Tepidisphaeraceae bacterium]